jgi:hypothetical protein
MKERNPTRATPGSQRRQRLMLATEVSVMQKPLTTKPCILCDEGPAVTPGGACEACNYDLEWWESHEFEIPNEERCATCNGVLRRGHCYDCIDRAWSPWPVAS